MNKNRHFAKPHLITKKLHPENQETPIHFIRRWTIPKKYFFRRNHFPYPQLTSDDYSLQIEGLVGRPLTFHYKDIISMPAKKVLVVLECAGNKRNKFEPKVFGEQWEDGAITQGYWKGVPLKYLLQITGIKKGIKEVVFVGADSGEKTGYEEKITFARSLPIENALHPEVIIAYEYNNRPIPYKHGYPLRLIVPGWYAMSSVKWLKRIILIEKEFKGPFQTDDYVYYPNKDSNVGYPVTTIHVNSIIQKPLNYDILKVGSHKIEGIAWTGVGTIKRVEISTDNGKSWHMAELKKDPSQPHSWNNFTYLWKVEESGEYTILSKATDTYGNSQPMTPYWNKKGYGYNAVYINHIKIE